jgi:protein phosphatase 1G
MVLNLPEIHTETIDKDTEFLIIAWDGIWDCMTNQEAVDFI